MRSSTFVFLWLIVLGFLGLEYYQLHHEKIGLIGLLKNRGWIESEFNSSPEAGRPISLFLGWSGISVMLATNLYIFRKRFEFMQGWGALANWLNFHIFCGLLGPTFIVFHSNFQVRGLVAVSFWSMMISVASGVVGRYFYQQLARLESDFLGQADLYIQRLKRVAEKRGLVLKEENLAGCMHHALKKSGALTDLKNPFAVLFSSLIGDVNLILSPPLAPTGTGESGSFALKCYAVNRRRARNLGSFRQLMGYWHTFHMPFAIFMYVAAAFHIAAALILGVKK